MRKIFISLILFFSCSYTAFVNAAPIVEPDRDIHELIGSLYTLAAAVDVSGSTRPDIRTLNKCFVKKLPEGFDVKRVNNVVWVGVPVAKNSSVRSYLRSHSEKLLITDSPEGHSWLGGDYAWMRAGRLDNGKLNPIKLFAAHGSGKDSGLIFFSTPKQDSWWLANPALNGQASQSIISKFGVKNPPELHEPLKAERISIYDSVRPSPVSKPGKMHVGGSSSNDMSIAVGDVMINPIPNTRR